MTSISEVPISPRRPLRPVCLIVVLVRIASSVNRIPAAVSDTNSSGSEEINSLISFHGKGLPFTARAGPYIVPCGNPLLPTPLPAVRFYDFRVPGIVPLPSLAAVAPRAPRYSVTPSGVNRCM